MGNPRQKYALPLAIALIVIAVVVTFGPLVRCGFTDWDDQDTIWSNPHMRPATVSSISYYWAHAEGELYIPLTYTVWGALSRVAPLHSIAGVTSPNPAVFHAANIAIHLATSILALLLLRRLIQNDWAACAGALLFALHPLQTETIAWASGTKDLLCGFFVVLSLWQYVIWAQSDPERRKKIHYALAIVALVLGTLCKPTAVVAPALAFAVDFTLIRKSFKPAIAALWPWLLAIVPCIIWTRLAQPASLGANVPLALRPIVALDALAFYLGKMIAPVSLAIDYGRTPTRAQSASWLWFTWIAPAVVAVIVLASRKKAPALLCAALLAVCGLAPVLGFVSYEFQIRSTVADHYLYIPMLGVGLAAAWAIANSSKKASFYTAAILLGMLSLRSLDQTQYWKDSRALFSRALIVNPLSEGANENLGVLAGYDAELAEAKAEIYLERHDRENAQLQRTEAMKKLQEADAFLSRVLELKPGDASALHTRAALHARFGRHEEAIVDLRELLAQLPHLRSDEKELFKRDYDLLGRELLIVGRPREAMKAFDQMLALDPDDRSALRGKDRAYSMLRRPPATEPTAKTE